MIEYFELEVIYREKPKDSFYRKANFKAIPDKRLFETVRFLFTYLSGIENINIRPFEPLKEGDEK